MTRLQTTVTVVTANIGRGETSAAAASNIGRVMTGFKPVLPWKRSPLFVGFQEIDEADGPDEHAILRKAAAGSSIVGFAQLCPLVVPPEWAVIHEEITKTCQGRPKVTPTRVAVQALAEHRDTGLRAVFVNGHYPHNAPDLWADCQRMWIEVVERWLDTGYTVITTRDRNRAGTPPALSPFEVPLLEPKLIDKITVIQATGKRAVRVVPGKTRRVNLTIDGHDAWGRALTLVRA